MLGDEASLAVVESVELLRKRVEIGLDHSAQAVVPQNEPMRML